MMTQLSSEAVELERVVRATLAGLGGVDLVRRAVDDPRGRQAEIEAALSRSGVFELEPLRDQVELEAAAAVCRAAGWSGLPYPLPERLAADGPGRAVALVRELAQVAPHVDLPLDWYAVDLRGRRWEVRSTSDLIGSKLGPFVARIQIFPAAADSARTAALVQTLQVWWLLGLLDRAVSLGLSHLSTRQQFGRSLSHYQGLQFAMTDAAVATGTLAELAKYTLWSVFQADRVDGWLADAAALRVTALESSDTVLRVIHQAHGAVGFCDEHDLSWLTRMSQPYRRLPMGREESEAVLLEHMRSGSFDGLFDSVTPESSPTGLAS